jgi:hypothetical protein
MPLIFLISFWPALISIFILFSWSLVSQTRWSSNKRACHWTQGSRVQTRTRTLDFKCDKIHSTPSYGREAKLSVPCRRFTACKRTLDHEKMHRGKIQRPCFSPVFHLLRY